MNSEIALVRFFARLHGFVMLVQHVPIDDIMYMIYSLGCLELELMSIGTLLRHHIRDSFTDYMTWINVSCLKKCGSPC